MFDELKQEKHINEIEVLKSLPVKAEPYLETKWVSMIELFYENR